MKSLIGLLLVALSIGGMVFWESRGRDSLISSDVLIGQRMMQEVGEP